MGRHAWSTLFDCLKSALEYMGVVGWENKLIGFGCDGTNANIGKHSGLKAHLKEAVPWVVVFWCLAHRLELSLKDASRALSLPQSMSFSFKCTIYTKTHLRSAVNWR